MDEQHPDPPYPPPAGYEPPPAFAPPVLRVAPLNETQVLGRTSYPSLPYRPGASVPPMQPMQPMPPPYWPQQNAPSAQGAQSPQNAQSAQNAQWPQAPGRVTWEPPPVDRAALRRRRLSYVTGGAVVLALVAIVSVLLGGPARTHPSRTLTLPQSVDEYTRISTIGGQQLHGLFGSAGGTFGAIPASDLQAAKVGVYGAHDAGQPSLVFIGFTADDSPSIGAQLRHDSADNVTRDVLAGATTGATTTPVSVTAGPLGGSVKCANLRLDGEDASAGVWADADTLGIVLIIDSTRTDHTSTVIRHFRAQAEH